MPERTVEPQRTAESGESGESDESEEADEGEEAEETNGTEGANGTEETNGTERANGTDGAEETNGTDGTDGPETADDGANGAEETNGADGTESPNGTGRASLPRDATLLPGWTVCAHTARVSSAPSCASGASIDTRVANGPDLVHVPTPRHGNVYGGPASERNLRGTLGVFLVNCEVSTARAIERGASPDVPMHKQIVPNPRYVEWMMGFPEDWTRVDVPATTPIERRPSYRSQRSNGQDGTDETGGTEDGPSEANGPVRASRASRASRPIRPNDGERVFRRNGMHVLMSDRSLGVRAASVVWRAMSLAERAVYSERARCE